MTIGDGEIEPYERVRTASKALARLKELGLAALARGASGAGALTSRCIISTIAKLRSDWLAS